VTRKVWFTSARGRTNPGVLIDCVDVSLRDCRPCARGDSPNVPELALEKSPPMLANELYQTKLNTRKYKVYTLAYSL
jgi:hypothetical protein